MGAMAFAALLGGGAQVMLKRGSALPIALNNAWLWGFVACYGIAVIINLVAYRLGGHVGTLYPVVALSYAFALFFAWKFLGEPVTGLSIAGVICIIAGIGLIGWGAS